MVGEHWEVPAWAILKEARRQAGLSQAELAARSGTSQSAIARYERARTLPSLTTLYRLVRACGLEMRIRLEPYTGDPAEGLIRDALARTVEDRLQSNDNTSRLTAELHQVAEAGDD